MTSKEGMNMEQQVNAPAIRELDSEARELSDRRDFLRSLSKWSTAAISAILLIESAPSREASPGGWARSDGAWLNSGTNSWRLRMAQQPRGRRQLG